MRFGGIVFTLLLSLGACSSDPEPQEPKASATPTPTVTAPAMPPQAKLDSPEGAAAFVKHYVDVFNYAAATGDVEELSRLSSPMCDGCQSYIKLYKDTYAAGGYFKGGEWKIGDFTLQEQGETTYLTTVAKTEPGPYRVARNKPEKTSTGRDNEVSFAVKRADSSWAVSQFGLGGVE